MTEKTIAVVGAGPGVGMAVAERFGGAGYRVALLARNVSRLRDLAGRLAAEGIQTEVFEPDVLDRSDLAESLDEAAQRLGPIDVLEYSPVPPMASMRQPRDIDVENELFELDFSVLGAIAAVGTVLPGVLSRGTGGLLFTTAPSAAHPLTVTASFGVAAAALLRYVELLNRDLRPDGVYAGVVSIAGVVASDDPAVPQHETSAFPPGLPLIPAAQVAELHWHMRVARDSAYTDAGDIDTGPAHGTSTILPWSRPAA
jgi:NADP-dependent 3-hydroxy acid dehydrogenase YdfG